MPEPELARVEAALQSIDNLTEADVDDEIATTEKRLQCLRSLRASMQRAAKPRVKAVRKKRAAKAGADTPATELP